MWVDEGPVRDAAEAAVARATEQPRPRRTRTVAPLPDEVRAELEAQAGSKRAPRLGERLEAARGAFERERYSDTRRMLLPLVQEAPGASSVRELLGLTYYRMDRWKQAVTELEAYRVITGSVDQHPVLMDCYRALRKYKLVDGLWDELKAASPGPALVTEGRIVRSGALADQGKLREAIALLEKADSTPKKVREDHLRQWYALGDLYDRGGDVPRARALFGRVRQVAPDFGDVEDRLRGLGR